MSNSKEAIPQECMEKLFFRASVSDFRAIPGKPIAYWLSDKFRKAFVEHPLIGGKASAVCGMTTGENAKFVREWHEVGLSDFNAKASSPEEAKASDKKWFPYAKGGEFRKWYGNADNVVNWENDGQDILSSGRAYPRSRKRYFRPSVSWSFLSSSYFGVRQQPKGFIFDMAGCSLFPDRPEEISLYTGALCAKTAFLFLKAMNPTMNFQVNNVAAIPLPKSLAVEDVEKNVSLAVEIGKRDWDSYETSWDFKTLSLLSPDHRAETLEDTYAVLRNHWLDMVNEMRCLEEDNNRIFINAYGLQDELSPEVPLEEITLTCNPAYRYGVKGSEEDRETRLRADTMGELLSYAVGCMFGRYALDKPGLILANQGETIEDYLKRVPEPSFPADDDNVIPMLDGDWFTDDITERFREFLRIAFGEEHYDENLRFVEQALGKDIRKYFLKDFYNDHVRRYKKRPIYWLFSSPKGSFNALIYMHRYQPHTVGTVLEYLRDFKDEKLQARKNHLEAVSISAGASQGEKTKALKEIEKINKILAELDDYERDVLYPLATEQVEIDLDDGVKANYPKFGDALKKIPGLS